MDKIKVEMDEGIVLSELIEFMGDKFDVEDVVRSGGDGVYELFYGCRGGYEGIIKNDMMDELDDNNTEMKASTLAFISVVTFICCSPSVDVTIILKATTEEKRAI